MSKRDWIKYAAFGLGLALLAASFSGWLVYKYEASNKEAREEARTNNKAESQKPLELTCLTLGKGSASCTLTQPETDIADKYTEADLKAQQDMVAHITPSL